jgi:hypothetical protein
LTFYKGYAINSKTVFKTKRHCKMERKEVESLYLNGKMMDDNPDTILARFAVLDEAADAIREAYVGEQPEEYENPADFDSALNYATGLLYRTGSAVASSDDAERVVESDLDWARLKKSGDWLPETPEQIKLVEDLFIKGSLLALEDKEPAFAAHQQGRGHEALDSYDTKYNKFGVLVQNQDQP